MNKFTVFKIAAFVASALFLQACTDAVSQNPPPHRIYWTNGDPGNVSGYNVYCGDASRAYTQNWNIGGENNTEILLTSMNLTDGHHFCAVTAYNFVGESDFSNEIDFYTFGGDLQKVAPLPPSNLMVE